MHNYRSEEQLLQYILYLSNRLQAVGDSFYPQTSAKQWYLICYIDGFPPEHPPTIKELAEKMGTSHQNVKQMAVRLEQKGLLRFLPDPADRRKLRVQLTERCEPLWEQCIPVQQSYVRSLFRGVSEAEQEALRQALEKISHNIQEMDCKRRE